MICDEFVNPTIGNTLGKQNEHYCSHNVMTKSKVIGLIGQEGLTPTQKLQWHPHYLKLVFGPQSKKRIHLEYIALKFVPTHLSNRRCHVGSNLFTDGIHDTIDYASVLKQQTNLSPFYPFILQRLTA